MLVGNAKEKRKGQVEESDTDAILRPLLEYMCTSAISAGDAFWWLFTLLQWNCMARSQNIDNLRFTNFKVADDSIVVSFNQTKKDKEGKKTTPKHCYANPFKFYFCLFTALAVYFCSLNTSWVTNKEYIFINQGSNEGTASSSYCETIRNWAVQKIAYILHDYLTQKDNCEMPLDP